MIDHHIQFHNIAEIRRIEGRTGQLLQRVPESIRVMLNEGAAARMLDPAGAEIRFLTDGDKVRITLSSLNGVCEIRPFWGGFQSKDTYRIGNEPTLIELEYPPQLAAANLSGLSNMAFSPRTWRLLLSGGPVLFHGIEGEGIRPPEDCDLPKRKIVIYGTSITQGAHASGPHLTYAALLARRLQADVFNLGAAGSAHCEAAMADYIASRSDWDMAVLSVSVNMVGAKFTVDQFEERITYMIRTIADSTPGRPVFCVSIFPHSRDYLLPGVLPEQAERTMQFRQTLRKVTEKLQRSHVTFIEGPELLTQIDGLSTDMIHPGDIGMMEIAENLSRRILHG